MKKFLKNKFLALVLASGLTAAIAGVALAGNCPQNVILVEGGSVYWCELFLEIIFEDGTSECNYECHLIN